MKMPVIVIAPSQAMIRLYNIQEIKSRSGK
jgi:hypothetical protein